MFKKYGLKMVNESSDELINLLEESEKNNSKDLDYEIFKALTNMIHCSVDYIDRIKYIEKQDEKLFNATRYVNNALKHKQNLAKINNINGYFSFPLIFPIKPTIYKYEWVHTNNIKDKQREKQEEAYNEIFRGIDVLSTIKEIKNAINRYNI